MIKKQKELNQKKIKEVKISYDLYYYTRFI